jgi:hypothetical protein
MGDLILPGRCRLLPPDGTPDSLSGIRGNN